MHFNIISNFLDASVNGDLKHSIITLNFTCEAPYYNNVILLFCALEKCENIIRTINLNM